MKHAWLTHGKMNGVSDVELARVSAFEGVEVVDRAEGFHVLRVLVGSFASASPELLARSAQRLDGASFRENYGLDLSQPQRLAKLRHAAASALPDYHRWDVAHRFLAGCGDEGEREEIAALANTLMHNINPGDRWIARGAFIEASQGRPAASRAGSALWLREEDEAAVRWLLDDPTRLPNARILSLAGGAEWTIETLRRLQGRGVEQLLLSQTLSKDWDAVFAALPTDCEGVDLHYREGGADMIARLVAHPAWSAMRCVRIHKNDAGTKGLSRLLGAARSAPLEELDLGYNGLKGKDFALLAKSDLLDGVQKLALEYNDAKAVGAKALLSSPKLGALRTLHFGANEIGDEAIAALCANNTITQLEELGVRGNYKKPLLSRAAVESLASWDSATSLRTLDLGLNALGDDGVLALLSSPKLAGLEAIDLEYNGCTPKLAATLAGDKTVVRAKRINLSGNVLGPHKLGARFKKPTALAGPNPWLEARWLSECVSLELTSTGLDDATLAWIVQSPQLAKVRSLSLGNGELGMDALQALVTAPALANLEYLFLFNWSLSPGAGAMLAAATFRSTILDLVLPIKGLDHGDLVALHEAYGHRLHAS